MAFQWAYVAPRVPLTVARQYPSKTGGCSISGCKRTPTEWHHIISQAQIIRRRMPESMFTDPGNLQELCRYHHNMTTASMDRKRLTKKHGPLGKRKPRMTEDERNAAKKKAKEKKQKEKMAFLKDVIEPSLDAMHSRGAASLAKNRRPQKKTWDRWTEMTEWEGFPIERAYPPDHWLHDPEQYIEDLSLEIEAEGSNVWCKGGGFTHCHDNWREGKVSKVPPYIPYGLVDNREQVVCAKCNRIGHESKNCYTKSVETDKGPLGRIGKKLKEGLPRR